MHRNQEQQDAAVAVPDAVRRVQVLFAVCMQVQGLRRTTATLCTRGSLLR